MLPLAAESAIHRQLVSCLSSVQIVVTVESYCKVDIAEEASHGSTLQDTSDALHKGVVVDNTLCDHQHHHQHVIDDC